MEVRRAEAHDNKTQMGEIIYFTDKYIYPCWFGDDKEKGKLVLGKLVGQPNGVHYYKNCLVAVENNKVVGLLIYFDEKTDLSFDYENYLTDEGSRLAIENYILKLNNYQREGEIYISNVGVLPEYRKRGIASELFKLLFDICGKNKTYKLDVLKSNKPAQNLYEKLGFEVTKRYNGFAGTQSEKVPCFHMKKEV